MAKYAVCVVDDQQDELDRAERYLGERFDLGVGTSPKAALDDLKTRKGRSKPHLWLIDMYYAEGRESSSDPPSSMREARAELLRAEARFHGLLGALRQTPESGFRKLEDARALIRAPGLFFTRKGTIDNAIRAYEDSDAAGVLRKPDPEPSVTISVSESDLPELYDAAFEASASEVAAKMESVIHRSTWWARNRERVLTAVISSVISFATGIASGIAIAALN